MITEIKRDLRFLKEARVLDERSIIHYLINLNVYAKLSESHKKQIDLYRQLSPTIKYQTRMISLIPYWWQFQKKKKFWAKYGYYKCFEKHLISQLKKLEIEYKREEKNLIKWN